MQADREGVRTSRFALAQAPLAARPSVPLHEWPVRPSGNARAVADRYRSRLKTGVCGPSTAAPPDASAEAATALPLATSGEERHTFPLAAYWL